MILNVAGKVESAAPEDRTVLPKALRNPRPYQGCQRQSAGGERTDAGAAARAQQAAEAAVR